MHPRMAHARPLALATQRDEVAADLHIASAFTTRVQMLAVDEPSSSSSPRDAPPCASAAALDHPGLDGAARRARALGYRVAVDTSLRDRPNIRELPRSAQFVLSHCHSLGAYFSPPRKCIGLAEDAAWHELVHELVHLNVDARNINPAVRGHSGTRPSAAEAAAAEAAAGPAARDDDPLRTHMLGYRARGYGPLAAEELVAREHELRALTCSGAPLWRWATKALVVADSALIEAQIDLSSTPAEQRTPAQTAEWRRVGLVRGCVTGPLPRLAYVALPLVGLSVLAGAAWRRVRAMASTTADARPRDSAGYG